MLLQTCMTFFLLWNSVIKVKQVFVIRYMDVTPRVRTITPNGSWTRDAGAGGGRSTKEAKGYSL